MCKPSQSGQKDGAGGYQPGREGGSVGQQRQRQHQHERDGRVDPREAVSLVSYGLRLLLLKRRLVVSHGRVALDAELGGRPVDDEVDVWRAFVAEAEEAREPEGPEQQKHGEHELSTAPQPPIGYPAVVRGLHV